MTKLKDLAHSLGLSQTTVSRALNGYAEVNEATRDRVLVAAKKIGYRANPTARRLALGKSHTIGLVYPPKLMPDLLFLQTVAGLTETLSHADYDFHIVPALPQNEQKVYQHLIKGQLVDGLIVARTCIEDPRIAYLAQQNFPYIAYGRTQQDLQYSWFDLDNDRGSVLAVDYLYQSGRRNIAYLYDDLQVNFAYQRHTSYGQRMAQLNLPTLDGHCGHTEKMGADALGDVRSRMPQIDALIVDNPLAALGVLRALLDSDYVIGRDIEVVVFGGGAFGSILKPVPMIMVDLGDAYDIGQQLGQLILGAVKGEAVKQILWQPSLRIETQ